METQVACPVEGCDDTKTARGLHGHIQFAHGYAPEEAREISAKAKREAGLRKSGGKSGDAGVEESISDSDDIDETLQSILKRMEQRQKIETIKGLSNSNEEGPGNQFMQVLEVLKAAESFTGKGESLTKQEAREVFEEISQNSKKAVTDGGATDPVTAAIGQGISDPETLEAISKMAPKNRASQRKWDVIESLAGNVNFESVSQLFGSVIEASVNAKNGSAEGNEIQPAEQQQRERNRPQGGPQRRKYADEVDDGNEPENEPEVENE